MAKLIWKLKHLVVANLHICSSEKSRTKRSLPSNFEESRRTQQWYVKTIQKMPSPMFGCLDAHIKNCNDYRNDFKSQYNRENFNSQSAIEIATESINIC